MPTTIACAERISAATLSAFHDGALTPRAMARLRAHIATCAACQQQLADFTALGALLRRPAPALESTPAQQRRTWLAIRARITQSRRLITMSLSRAAIWKSAGALVAAALIATLVFTFAARDIHRSLAQHPTASSVATPQALTPEQAWGAQYIHQIALSDPNFAPTSIAPNGSLAVGEIIDQRGYSSSSVVALNLATGKMQTIATLPANANLSNIFTDGRYVAWWMQPDANSTEEIVVYDMTTRKLAITEQSATGSTLSGKTISFSVLSVWGVDHGYLLWTHNGQSDSDITLYVTNLATGQTSTLATQLGSLLPFEQIAWPFVFYQDQYANLHLYHLPDGQDAVLPPALPGGQLTFTGTAVFNEVILEYHGSQYVHIQELSSANLPTATWHTYYDLYLENIGYPQVNGRLLLWFAPDAQRAIILDVVRQQTSFFLTNQLSRYGFGIQLQGKWLYYVTMNQSNTQATYNYIDTSQLPTK